MNKIELNGKNKLLRNRDIITTNAKIHKYPHVRCLKIAVGTWDLCRDLSVNSLMRRIYSPKKQ